MLTTWVGLIIGLAGLYFGGSWLVTGASRIAQSLGIPALIVGLTVVSIGTSMPELLVSISAAPGGSSDIAIGNVVGSNIFNLPGILGATALVSPITVTSQIIRFDGLIMIAFSLLMIPFVLDRKLGRLESIGFVVAYLAYTIYLVSGAI